MLDEYLYGLAVMLGSLITCASREWGRSRPEELRGAFQGVVSFMAGVIYLSLVFFPFLLWHWWIGIIAPVACGLFSVQIMTYSPLMGWVESRGIQCTKNIADLLLIALGATLWARYFGGG